MNNFPSDRTRKIKAQYGVSSICIGCIFNGEEPWPDTVLDDKGRVCKNVHLNGKDRLVQIFPHENHICKNPDSSKHGDCIIGSPGCDKGRYEK